MFLINLFATFSYIFIYKFDKYVKDGRKDELKMQHLKQKQAEIV